MRNLTVVQITTPHSVGTGFFWPSTNVVITNAHVVQDHRHVVINENGQSSLGEVFYLDSTYDLAFIQTKREDPVDLFEITGDHTIQSGERVIALGYVGDDHLQEFHGTIRQHRYSINGVAFIQHDVPLDYGASGGPLVLKEGGLIGINCFVGGSPDSFSFAIPLDVVQQALGKTVLKPGLSVASGLRCDSCKHIVLEQEVERSSCPICGAKLYLISDWQDFEPTGMGYTIESLLGELGYDVRLARQGLNQWIVHRGSARITLSYHHRSGLIVGESELLTLEEHRIFEIYRYLLQQNNSLRSLSFSMAGMKVMLSTVIHDQFLEESSAKELLKDLFEKSDEYDDILISMNRK